MDQTTSCNFSVPPTIFAEFPSVPRHVIESIGANEFKPADLYKLAPTSSAKLGSCTGQSEKEGLEHYYADYKSLVEVLLVYFNILSELAAHCGEFHLLRTVASGTTVYIGRLLGHARCHPWEETLDAHLRFHEKRCMEMSRGDFTGWKSKSLIEPASPPSLDNISLWQTSPPEILEIIFNHAVIPPLLLDPSLIPGPNSTWCKNIRTQKSIVLVCKTWYACGISLLYQNINIRRMPQFPALLDALTSSKSTSELWKCVRIFTVSCFVEAEDTHPFQQHIIQIFGLCSNLTRFGFSSPFERLPITSALHHLRPTITQLCLDSPSQIEYTILVSILNHLGPRLRFLLICLHRIDITEGRHVPLPDLETLICHIDKDELCWQLSTMTTSWYMPKLRNLTLLFADYRGLGRASGRHGAAIQPFFARHGHHLKFVDLTAYISRTIEKTGWEDFLRNLCPLLEHLVVDEDTFDVAAIKESLSSSRLKWLDFRQPSSYLPPRDLDETFEEETGRYRLTLPRLVQIRRLWDLPIYFAEWVQTFPVAASTGNLSDDFVVDMYDGRFVNGRGKVSLDVDQEGYDTQSDDESYEPSSSESDGSDTDSCSFSDLESDDGTEESTPDAVAGLALVLASQTL